MTWLDALLGRISSRGAAALDAQGTLNFDSPLRAVVNTGAARIDVSLVPADLSQPPWVGVLSDDATYSPADATADISGCRHIYVSSTTSGGHQVRLLSLGAALGDDVLILFGASASTHTVYDDSSNTLLATVATGTSTRCLRFVYCSVSDVSRWILFGATHSAVA